MKKILSFLLLAAIAVGANAQKDSTKAIWFSIQKEGYFAADDGKDYIIYHQEGKTAKELYDMVCVNANRIYNMPQRVMSTVEGKSVSIRAYSNTCMYNYFMGKFFYEVCYNLLFEFKDGKIKINAPVINSISGHDTFKGVIRYYWDSKGNLTKKGQERKSFTEFYFCKLLSDLVSKYEVISKDDDW